MTNLNSPTLEPMNLQISTATGLLTGTVQHSPTASLILGFLKRGQLEEQETYGGCDLNGMHELRRALGAGHSILLEDASSGELHARIIWDEAGQLLTLRAAGETVDVALDDQARVALGEFLTNVLMALS